MDYISKSNPLVHLIRHLGNFPVWRRLCGAFFSGSRPKDGDLACDLERLAEISPHLLEDIGLSGNFARTSRDAPGTGILAGRV